MTDSAHLDKVAEAIWQADHPTWTSPKHWPWEKVDPTRQDDYRRMAQAATDALQLTEETKQLADGAGGISTNMKSGETTVYMKPCTRMKRLVSPWVRVDGGDA